MKATCETCGYDLASVNTGDGPASFIMQIAGGIVAFSALYVEIAYRPPIWLHMVIWLPLATALSLALMRPGKGLMIALAIRGARDER